MTPPARNLTDDDVRALQPVLRGLAIRAVGPGTIVDDLVQETLLAAIRGLSTFDGRSELRTWVAGILAHKAVDHLRRARRWEDVNEVDEARLLSWSLSWGRPSPERAAETRQALRLLDRALPTLPDKERLAVLLCDVEGLDRQDACNILGVSATNLRVLLHRARHRLRKALEG